MKTILKWLGRQFYPMIEIFYLHHYQKRCLNRSKPASATFWKIFYVLQRKLIWVILVLIYSNTYFDNGEGRISHHGVKLPTKSFWGLTSRGNFFTREIHFTSGILDWFWKNNIPRYARDVIFPQPVSNPLGKVNFPGKKITSLVNPQND